MVNRPRGGFCPFAQLGEGTCPRFRVIIGFVPGHLKSPKGRSCTCVAFLFRWFWLLLHSIYVITGAALSAVVVLTLTGVLRQD